MKYDYRMPVCRMVDFEHFWLKLRFAQTNNNNSLGILDSLAIFR